MSVLTEPFFITKKIYYHNTDAGGVVYYANYLLMLEEARTEFCRAYGIDTAEWLKKDIGFVVVHLQINYRRPAYYADIVRVYVKVKKIGNSSIHFIQDIYRDNTLLVDAEVIWATVTLSNFKTTKVPEEIRSRLVNKAEKAC
ncbi:MAG: acyl-CoA thioesterase [Candidatus Omnitrophica bacterium]|nr:acyl-CoA thioesterase [Candidatus Omnitrophota bacterium]